MSDTGRMKATFSVLDYVVFVAMLCISISIGIFYAWKGRKKSSNEEFFMGSRKLGLLPVSLSLVATFLSAITVLGFPAEVYTHGTQVWMLVLPCIFSLLMATQIFLPVFFRLKITSVNHYLMLRFNSPTLRLIASLFFLTRLGLYLGVVVYAPAVALGSVTDLSDWASVLVVGLICTFYTTVGGMKAVVWTDAVQVTIMVAGLLAVAIKGSIRVGGLSEVFNILDQGGRYNFGNFQFDWFAPNTFWCIVLGFTVGFLNAYGTNQMEVQRYCAMKTETKAKIALLLNIPYVSFIMGLACMCGAVIYANYHGCDPLQRNFVKRADQLMPYFVMEHLNTIPGLPGLFVACVFSAALSTLSSGLNSIAAVVWEDALKHVVKVKEHMEIWITKALAAVSGIITIGMAFLSGNFTSVLQAAIALSGCQAGPFVAVFMLGLLLPFTNSKGAISGLISGQILVLWITIGGLIYPKPKYYLPTSVENCTDLMVNGTLVVDQSKLQDPYYKPALNSLGALEEPGTGILALYHTNTFFVPVLGFIATLTIGMVVSLFTGLNGNKPVDPSLLSPFVVKLLKLRKHEYKVSDDIKTNGTTENPMPILSKSMLMNSDI